MFDFYQKRKLKTIIQSPITQCVLLSLTLLVAWSAFERYSMAVEMESRRETIEQEATALQSRKEMLEKKVEYLSNDRGLEAEMRRQFDVAKDGEKVVVIVEEEEAVVVEPFATSTQAAWYQFWR